MRDPHPYAAQARSGRVPGLAARVYSLLGYIKSCRIAFVSEIKYDGTGEAAHSEFIEITLSPSDIPADLTLGFYESNGTLRPGTSSFFPTAGEITLQDVINAAGGTNNSAASTVGGLDLRDLRVSRQHRMLICSVVAQRMFGESEVLIPAQVLVGFPGITMERARKDLRYLHLLMDRHELVLAEGVPTEALLLGSQSQEVIPPLILNQVLPLLLAPGPALGATEPARLIPSARKYRKLLARIRKNHHPLLDLPKPQALRA